MNLTLAELADLPLPAALVRGDDVLVGTPEWSGAGPGAVSYPLRNGRLVVSADAGVAPACVPVLDRLLDELDGLAARMPRPQSLRAEMLAASLGLLAGRLPVRPGTGRDVVDYAAAGITARTGLQVTTHGRSDGPVPAPPAAALVLVQLAANAERHDGATAIDLEAADGVFTLRWRGPPASSGHRPSEHRTSTALGSPARLARSRADRTRWGLGFARVATDAIGGALFPPLLADDGHVVAVLEVGPARLSLPLAAVRDGRVLKATRAWDEETGAPPSTPVVAGGRIARCLEAASTNAGAIVSTDGWCGRRTGQLTWIAVPPDGIVDRAGDVLDGMVHERALWEGVPGRERVRVVGLASVLGTLLGAPLPRVPGKAWNHAAPRVAAALGLPSAPPHFAGVGAVDPQVALLLAAEIGEGFDCHGDHLVLRVRPDRCDHYLARALVPPGARALQLS